MDNGPCGWQTFGWRSIYGYTVENTLGEPMTIWVGRGVGSTGDADKRWWTLNPAKRSGSTPTATPYIYPSTAAAYNACQPAS